MSMNLFFVACAQNELNEMIENNTLIDELVDSESYLFSTDVETAWDVLRNILGGVGIEVGQNIDNALFNGCSLISSEEVKAQAVELSKWSKEDVLNGLRNIEDSEAYHLEAFQDDEEYLLVQFDKMVNFYKEAAEKGCAAISYAA